MPHNHREISAWCLHKDKNERSNHTQLDKASLNKERIPACDWTDFLCLGMPNPCCLQPPSHGTAQPITWSSITENRASHIMANGNSKRVCGRLESTTHINNPAVYQSKHVRPCLFDCSINKAGAMLSDESISQPPITGLLSVPS